MATQIENIYISGTVTDSIEMRTSSLRFPTVASSRKCQQVIANGVLQPKWRHNGYCYFRLSFVVSISGGHFLQACRTCHCRQPQIYRWNFDVVYLIVTEILLFSV